jgi:hypothetical protein
MVSRDGADDQKRRRRRRTRSDGADEPEAPGGRTFELANVRTRSCIAILLLNLHCS